MSLQLNIDMLDHRCFALTLNVSNYHSLLKFSQTLFSCSLGGRRSAHQNSTQNLGVTIDAKLHYESHNQFLLSIS